jgi:hypothetical protein
MSTINASINGIMFENCTTIDPALQPYCPLEHTEYESFCQNQYHNVQLRPEEPCLHSNDCFNLRAKLNSEKP